MTTPKMHADELDIDAALVRRLLAVQFPSWSALALEPVTSAGTDNAIFRLGTDMVVRLPRRSNAARTTEKELQWLPALAPHLPLAISAPIAKGGAGEDYPFPWSVFRWLEGDNPPLERGSDHAMAHDLAQFIRALRKIETTGGPRPGAHNFWRGVDLSAWDRHTRAAIEKLQTELDAAAVTEAWDADLAAPTSRNAPVWIHGDLSAGNLLERDGRLAAVIDFGGLGVGDPACDLIVAWSFFTGEARAAFREALVADDATWARGRGWALSTALVALPHYRDSNPPLADASRRIIDAVLTDFGRAA